MIALVLMHQGIGLEAFNAMPMRRAVHAVYECCYSVPLAADVARGREYASHEELFRQADTLLFSLGEQSIDSILQAYPELGRRHVSENVLATTTDWLHNDVETERKIVRNEIARTTRIRLERMLGPEGGYDNW
jgi:2-oxo-4-hydroxy-4-carboxy-5-ureidoimidazoline decarboxylase